MKFQIKIMFFLFLYISSCQPTLQEKSDKENFIEFPTTQKNEEKIEYTEQEHLEKSITQKEHQNTEQLFPSLWTCYEIKKYFVKYCNEQKKPKECQQNDDCTLVGLRGDCDCSQGPTGVVEPISVPKNSQEILALDEKFFSTECYEIRQCSYHYSKGPNVFKPVCQDGLCKVTLREGFMTFLCSG